MQSPHDQLFHYTFGQPQNAAELLRGTLPAAIVDSIDWQTLTRCDTKLTDAKSESLYADLLFKVTTRGGPAYVFILLEHKSEADSQTAYQLLRYVVRIWDRHLAENPACSTLPPILVVVLHHGRTPWRGPRSLREMIDLSGFPTEMAAEILARQPDLTFHVDDLATQTEAQITARVSSLLGAMALLCMQFLRGASEDDAEAALRRWHGLLARVHAATDAQEAFLKLVEYIATISDLHRDRVRRIFAEVHPDAEQTYMKTYGRLEREAIERETRGEARGEARGKAEGKAEILLRQLDARFGSLAQETIVRVRAATPADLDRWAVQVLDAQTLDEALRDR